MADQLLIVTHTLSEQWSLNSPRFHQIEYLKAQQVEKTKIFKSFKLYNSIQYRTHQRL